MQRVPRFREVLALKKLRTLPKRDIPASLSLVFMELFLDPDAWAVPAFA